jgi:hypothetical protein
VKTSTKSLRNARRPASAWKATMQGSWILDGLRLLLKNGSSTFLIGKKSKVKFSGGVYDTRKSVPTDIGAG